MPETRHNHIEYMNLAIKEAEKAAQKGEVPIGAVLVGEKGDILSSAHNLTINNMDPSAHAEILVLRMGAEKELNYRLVNTTLYVTLEPCIMCMGAIIHARVSHVVFGAKDPKWGAAGSLYDFSNDDRLNHKVDITSGICDKECGILLQEFFKARRKHVASC